MGKPKKEKKSQDEDFGDDIVDDQSEEAGVKVAQPAAKKGKKGRKKKDDDWEDDIAGEIAALSMEAGIVCDEEDDMSSLATNQKKKKKKTRKNQNEDDEDGPDAEEEETEGGQKEDVMMSGDQNRSKMAAEFHMLDDDDDASNDDKAPSDDEPPAAGEAKTTTDDTQSSQQQHKKGKKGKKKAAGDEDREEDIDAILAQIESRGDTVPVEEKDADERDEEEDGEDGQTVKTAAQKKKEKKERQKQQKLQAKTKPGGGQQPKVEKLPSEDVTPETETATVPCEGAEVTNTDDTAAGGADDEAGDGADDKKKKKDRKKKKKGEEEETKTTKKPTKMVRAMQERLRIMQEEEEAHRKAEEERIAKEEEAERMKQEAERLEKEKREREKQKKKERIERLKAEGKFMTAKQKEAQKRAQQMLDSLREQGLDVPAVGERQEGEKKKRVVYSKKKKPQQQQHIEVVTPTTPEVEVVPPLPAEPTPSNDEVVDEKQEDVKGSWDDDDDTKDAWDASDDEEKEEEKVVTTAVVVEDKAPATKPDVPANSTDDQKVDEEGSGDEDDDTSSSSEEDEEEESSSEDSSDDSSDENDGLTLKERVRERALARMAKRREEAEKKRSTDVLRAAVVCVLGHVDTGKTKILDKLRRTNVQDGEAGGITQQIGATNVPYDAIREQTKMCKEFSKQDLKLPGLLIIDTPGHESFSNLRSRGSSLCDIAILVVDIMHGLEPQTIESLNLLKQRKTPFVVALNKVDRLFQWQSNPHADIANTIKKQKANTKLEFDERLSGVVVQFAEQGLNAAPFYENKNVREYVSMVPTSAHTGDGIGNLIALICELSQTLLAKRVSYSEELQATAMEVKALPGLGTTVDVILVNGAMKEGETIVLAGTDGAIVTQIRGLLMPHPMKEMRVKTNFEHHKYVAAAQGVKIIAKDLEKALAGLPVFVARQTDEVDILKDEIEAVLKDVLASIKLQERGVFVQASTLGSLEALLEFLNTSNIAYAGINIGPVHKKDIMKASIMLEHDSQYAVILAFDVKVEREAQELADSVGVTIFSADIIYHLFDAFTAHRARLKRERQDQFRHIAVFPCKLRVMPQFIFNSRDPIVMGVSVEAGFVTVGTPICVPSKEFVELGRVSGLELNHKAIDKATRGQEICVKIEPLSSEAPKMYGRHFEDTDMLISKISRQSIDAVKDYFRDDMTKADWQLMVELKKMFEIL